MTDTLVMGGVEVESAMRTWFIVGLYVWSVVLSVNIRRPR